ncbi:ABC-type glutathione transport system ATPase component [Micromonospora sp. A200]|nr:ABC-type glutathione transport system ATPase component [Micromonospora sp. A200]
MPLDGAVDPGFAQVDGVVFMDGGVVVEQGPPQEVLGAPQHERTRSFLSRVLDPTQVAQLGQPDQSPEPPEPPRLPTDDRHNL